MTQKTLVFLPGVLSDERVWSYQVAHMQDRVTCLVLPLMKREKEGDLVQMVLNRIDGNFFLAGHSMGGWLALELARKAPNRILKLCLLNTSAQPDPEEKHQRRIEMIRASEQGDFQRVAASLADHYVADERVKEEVLSMFLSVGKEVFIDQQKVLLMRQECCSFLSSLNIPTLVIHARKDKVFSLAVHEELVKQIPHAKLAIIEDSGHMSPMESPQAVTALLRFWLDYL